MSGGKINASMTFIGWNKNEIFVPTQMTRKITNTQINALNHLFRNKST